MWGTAPAAVPYLVTFGLSATACFAVAGFLGRRPEAPGERELMGLFAAIGVWGLNSIARVLVSDPFATRVLLTAELALGIASSSLWLLFAATYAGREPLSWRPTRYLLGGLLAVAVLLPATNGFHGLVWTAIEPETTRGVVTFAITKGPGHFAVTLTSYLLAFVGLFFLGRLLWLTPPARPALAALLSGFALLIGANLLPYVTELLVAHPPTVTPLGAAFGAAGVVVAVRYDLFGVVSVARRSVFETLGDPVIVVDQEARLLDANEAFAVRFADEPVGSPLATVSPGLAAGVDLTERTPQTVHLGNDPDEGHFSVTVSPVVVGAQVRARSLVLRDVSDLTAVTRQLKRQNDQLDDIAYSAAHNLRNPLGVISGYADVLRTHLETVDDPAFDAHLVDNSLEKIERNSTRMGEIITDLLRVTNASKAASDRSFVPVGAAVRSALDDINETDALSVTVERDGTVRANPEQLEMLFGSLVRATRDRADGPASISVTATEDGFAFADTAAPIDPEDADVFLSYGYTTKYPGTGLGLAVAQVLATSHGWDISVDVDYRDGLRVAVTEATIGEITDPASDGSHGDDPDPSTDEPLLE